MSWIIYLFSHWWAFGVFLIFCSKEHFCENLCEHTFSFLLNMYLWELSWLPNNFPKWLYPFTHLSTMYESSKCFIFLPAIGVISPLNFSPFDGCGGFYFAFLWWLILLASFPYALFIHHSYISLCEMTESLPILKRDFLSYCFVGVLCRLFISPLSVIYIVYSLPVMADLSKNTVFFFYVQVLNFAEVQFIIFFFFA